MTQQHCASITLDLHLKKRLYLMGHKHVRERRDVTQAVNFTRPSVIFQQPVLTQLNMQ